MNVLNAGHHSNTVLVPWQGLTGLSNWESFPFVDTSPNQSKRCLCDPPHPLKSLENQWVQMDRNSRMCAVCVSVKMLTVSETACDNVNLCMQSTWPLEFPLCTEEIPAFTSHLKLVRKSLLASGSLWVCACYLLWFTTKQESLRNDPCLQGNQGGIRSWLILKRMQALPFLVGCDLVPSLDKDKRLQSCDEAGSLVTSHFQAALEVGLCWGIHLGCSGPAHKLHSLFWPGLNMRMSMLRKVAMVSLFITLQTTQKNVYGATTVLLYPSISPPTALPPQTVGWPIPIHCRRFIHHYKSMLFALSLFNPRSRR